MNWLENVLKEQYDIVSVLNNKKASEVIRVRHKTLHKDMIVRRYKGDSTVYELLQKIRVEHIPEVYSAINEDGNCIVLEEFINGITVADVLRSGLYSEQSARAVVYQICDALNVLHSLNIVHRDIKPENIMINNFGKVYLIDFDVSRVFKEYKSDDTRILGTAGYAAPEQFGITQTDERADIFSIGVLLNVMLTGEHPSKKLYLGKLRKVIEKCTEVSPNKRYQSVDELKIKL